MVSYPSIRARLKNATDLFIVFVMSLETTAHTLAFAFTLLALHQDEQAKLIIHINEIIPVDAEAVSN